MSRLAYRQGTSLIIKGLYFAISPIHFSFHSIAFHFNPNSYSLDAPQAIYLYSLAK